MPIPSARVGNAVLTMAVSRVAMPIPKEIAITAGRRLLRGRPSAAEDINDPDRMVKAFRLRVDGFFFSGELRGCRNFHKRGPMNLPITL